jgi:hypothetical protein
MFRWVVAVALVMPALLGVGAAEAKPKRTCHPRHAYTMVANRQVRVYAVVHPYDYRDVFACYRRTGKRFELGTFDPHDVDYPYHVTVRLSRRMVGWISSYDDRYGNGWYDIYVRDARTHALLHHARQEGNSEDPGGSWNADALVMDRAGSIAWIATGSNPDRTYNYEVFKSDTTRAEQTLDSGPEIDPKSLRRDGKTVTWVKGGSTRTARFLR